MMKKGEIQFKFLFSLIFGAFLFGFIFLFIIQTFFLYQKYSALNIYNVFLSFLDIINLKKNSAATLQITSNVFYKIEFKGDYVRITVFTSSQNFPLYDKIVFSPTIESNIIYYDNKAIYFPFYTGSLIILLPINQKSFIFKKETNSFIIISNNLSFITNFYNEQVNPTFQESLSFCVGTNLTRCLEDNKIKRTDIKRILFVYQTQNNIHFLNSLNEARTKGLIKNNEKFWVVKAVKKGEFVYEIETWDKLKNGEEIKEILSGHGDFFLNGITVYLPKEFVFPLLVVDNKEIIEKNIEKFFKNIYSVYLTYNSISEESPIFRDNCNNLYQNDLNSIIDELNKTLNNQGEYSIYNISLFIDPLAQSIKEKNEEVENEKPICQLY